MLEPLLPLLLPLIAELAVVVLAFAVALLLLAEELPAALFERAALFWGAGTGVGAGLSDRRRYASRR